MGGVMDLTLSQTPTGIGNDGISPIIMTLVEDTPKPDLQASACNLKGLLKLA